jgi:RNA polymerase sigma-70 factor, ECF subfamily
MSSRPLIGTFVAFEINHPQMRTDGAGRLTDPELVRRACSGERDAFEAIYSRHQAIVYRFARSMTGSSAMADDVTQEVFVFLMQNLGRYQPQRASLSTYLYGIARNLTRARLRPERRFVDLEEIATRASEPAAPHDPLIAAMRSQDVARVRKAILDVPSRYREVVILCDLHGLSYAEAAHVIEIPVGTVRSRLNRGRASLIERLRDKVHGSQADRFTRCPA